MLSLTLSTVTPDASVVLSKYTSEASIGWTEQCELRYEVHLKRFSLLLRAQNGTSTLLEVNHLDLQSCLQSETSLLGPHLIAGFPFSSTS